ncbi:MAG: Hsp33 family molecular chaperone HslO [Variovorax sp.]
MSELHKFLFDGVPVRGMLVRLDGAWAEILSRRAASELTGAYPPPVTELLGEMTAAAALMQSNIKFKGSLTLQIFGDGPVKVAVAEANAELGLRATATINGDVESDARLAALVNVGNKGRCAITLQPLERSAGQQPYQGVVPLHDDRHDKLDKLSDVLQHYMLQSEQLDTTLVLAANEEVAAGLLIQRMPVGGLRNIEGERRAQGVADEDEIGRNEDYNRIAILASSLTRGELLTLDADTILRRLFWQEKLLRFEPQAGTGGPHFACTCSRERVATMIQSLGREEADSIVAERGDIEVACDFCGKQYVFDAVDAASLFTPPGYQAPGTDAVQ